jgi:hypothetical protein
MGTRRILPISLLVERYAISFRITVNTGLRLAFCKEGQNWAEPLDASDSRDMYHISSRK